MFKKTSCALALAALYGTSALASTQFGDHLTLSGFGTAGVVSTDNNKDEFVRDSALKGANKDPDWIVDSKFGLQLNGVATNWLSGTVQVLSEQRYDAAITTEIEWAFLKVTPIDNLNVRLGRLAPALFMVSDSRNVGYANIPVRMPNEVYALGGIKRLKGGDISYRIGFASTSFTATIMAGESDYLSADGVSPVKQLRGYNVVWETDFGTFRGGWMHAKVVYIDFEGVQQKSPYTFQGVGYQLDKHNWVVNAEYVQRKSSTAPDIVNSNGWYVLSGYRFNTVLPYAFMARTTTPYHPFGIALNGDQETRAVGVRWDVHPSADIKLQFEHVDPKDSMGVSFTPVFGLFPPVRDKTNAISLAVDFVF